MRKQKSQSASQNNEPIITKSCQSFLGRDPIESPSIEYQPKPRPKSFRDFDEENNFQDLTTAQKKQVSQAIKKELKIPNKDIKQENNRFNGENRRDRHFTDDILQSEEVSMADSSQQPPTKNNRKEQDQGKKKKKSYFNLILLGAASTGKTTFMECFLRQYKQKNQEITIKQHTERIIEVKSGGRFSNLSQQFYIIDTPGFTHSTINTYSQQIQGEIRKRIENTRKNRKDAMTVSAVFQSQQREIRDQRIHCCLFFFRGPRMHSDDWKLLQQLHDKCNIIPVIAKGDSYTIQQVIEIKKSIRAKAKEKGIQWFDIQEYIRQKHPSFLNTIVKGPYGPSPPFMIASSTNVNVEVKLCREYKWGKCLIQNSQHTDFQILYQILTKYLAEGFVKMIDVMEDAQKAKLEESHKVNIIVKGVGMVSVLTALFFVGTYFAKSHSSLKN